LLLDATANLGIGGGGVIELLLDELPELCEAGF
jgi:hypothetical protein